MTREELTQRNQEILDELAEEKLYLSGQYICIDTGDSGWKHKDAPELTYNCDEYLRSHLSDYRERTGKPFLASDIYYFNTLLSIDEVARLVNLVESAIYAKEHPDCEHLEYIRSGCWDEGLSGRRMLNEGKTWDVEGWTAVYVVTGGSEGYWLHVEEIKGDEPRRNLLLGKALCASWEECWESAERISRMLGA